MFSTSDSRVLQGWHEDRPRKPPRQDRGFIPLFDPPKAPPGRSWLLIFVSVALLVGLTFAFHQNDEEVQDVAAADNVIIQTRQAASLMSVEQEDSVLGPMRDLATSPGPTRRVATTWAALDRGDGTRSLIALSIMARIPEQVANGAPLAAPAELDPLLIQSFMYPLEMTEEERALIESEIGWPARLLFTRDLPDDDPVKTALYVEASSTNRLAALVVALAMLAGAIGMILLSRFWSGVRRGDLHFELEAPIAPSDIYLEAAAIYLACFALGRSAGLVLSGGGVAILMAIAQIGGSVLAVFWPALRGVPLRAMARDLGFHSGAGFWTEMRAGFVGYAAILPFFAAGVVTMFIARFALAKLGLDLQSPVHPSMVGLGESSMGQRLLVLGAAAVFAPLFEELMFRGAFFRGLRARWSFWPSALLGAVIFAAVHPQGLLAVPPLAGLAIGFAGLREWRSSLIAPMVAHALHNGILVLLITILLS